LAAATELMSEKRLCFQLTNMWRNIRIAILLLVLIWAAGHTWLDRVMSTRWRETLWVGVFPVNADGSPLSQQYIDGLDAKQFADVESFFEREAQRYGRRLANPVHVELYPQLRQTPPELDGNAGMLGIAAWSLKLRWFAWRNLEFGGRPPPRIRMLVLFHDPATLPTVPDSHGLQKGLLGVVHAFATGSMSGSNNIILAHELLHTLGATDKYDPATDQPLVPIGLGDPEQSPLYPQEKMEIMAGRRALSDHEAQMPTSLNRVVVGPVTAAEIRWTQR
jgi:hypothetical protein